jgi:hypothetical protein
MMLPSVSIGKMTEAPGCTMVVCMISLPLGKVTGSSTKEMFFHVWMVFLEEDNVIFLLLYN